jgi:hypothetical protein
MQYSVGLFSQTIQTRELSANTSRFGGKDAKGFQSAAQHKFTFFPQTPQFIDFPTVFTISKEKLSRRSSREYKLFERKIRHASLLPKRRAGDGSKSAIETFLIKKYCSHFL